MLYAPISLHLVETVFALYSRRAAECVFDHLDSHDQRDHLNRFEVDIIKLAENTLETRDIMMVAQLVNATLEEVTAAQQQAEQSGEYAHITENDTFALYALPGGRFLVFPKPRGEEI